MIFAEQSPSPVSAVEPPAAHETCRASSHRGQAQLRARLSLHPLPSTTGRDTPRTLWLSGPSVGWPVGGSGRRLKTAAEPFADYNSLDKKSERKGYELVYKGSCVSGAAAIDVDGCRPGQNLENDDDSWSVSAGRPLDHVGPSVNGPLPDCGSNGSTPRDMATRGGVAACMNVPRGFQSSFWEGPNPHAPALSRRLPGQSRQVAQFTARSTQWQPPPACRCARLPLVVSALHVSFNGLWPWIARARRCSTPPSCMLALLDVHSCALPSFLLDSRIGCH